MDLEQRFQQAVESEKFGQPNLHAIANRGAARARNKRIGAGAASLAVLAVGALSLSSIASRTPDVVEAADGSIAVDVDDGDGGLVSLDDSDGTPAEEQIESDEAPQSPGDEPGDDASVVEEEPAEAAETEVQPQPLLGALAQEFELCYSYDDESGSGTLQVWLDGDEVVQVEERRVRGGADDPAFVFDFVGMGTVDGLQIDATGEYISEGALGPSNESRSFLFSGDLSSVAGQQFVYTAQSCDSIGEAGAPVTGGVVADGYGGSLTVDPELGLVHQRVDGSDVVVELPSFDAVAPQRWPTDVASIGGTYYLLVDQFVNLEPGPGETDHFEVSILALNLETDEWIEVERRIITGVEGPDWVYNGHMTSNGEQILVMREFWQGTCMYIEALTLSGEVVDAPETAFYPRPPWLDGFTKEQAATMRDTDPDNDFVFDPCVGLDEIGDGGLAVLGRQAPPQAFAEFEADFLLRYG